MILEDLFILLAITSKKENSGGAIEPEDGKHTKIEVDEVLDGDLGAGATKSKISKCKIILFELVKIPQ